MAKSLGPRPLVMYDLAIAGHPWCFPQLRDLRAPASTEADMDLNQLLYQHQRALMSSDIRLKVDGEKTRLDLTSHYARKLHNYRAANGLQQY